MCFIATVDGEIAAFTSVIHFPHPRDKKIKRFHRTVVLPDYQGIGVSTHLRKVVAKKIKGKGFRLFSTTSHPAMIRILKKDPSWVCRRSSRVAKIWKTGTRSFKKSLSAKRITTSWEYVGSG